MFMMPIILLQPQPNEGRYVSVVSHLGGDIGLHLPAGRQASGFCVKLVRLEGGNSNGQ